MRASPAIALIAFALVACDTGDDDDVSYEQCTPESCQAACDEAYAEELASCGGICDVEAHCLSSGTCECNFLPCAPEACEDYCLEEGYEDGGCGTLSGNPLSCDCW
ncbi:MAG: hypothetical protein R6V85_01165 [Polyangia bacterium]